MPLASKAAAIVQKTTKPIVRVTKEPNGTPFQKTSNLTHSIKDGYNSSAVKHRTAEPFTSIKWGDTNNEYIFYKQGMVALKSLQILQGNRSSKSTSHLNRNK